MSGVEKPSQAPNWDSLFGVAQSQAGYLTTKQAARAGYSPQLLAHFKDKKLERVRRGIYRVIHFPPSDHEDLVVLWLWSEQTGVFSHETALALHDLSDVLPSKTHLTLPSMWRRRRFRVPAGLQLHFADIADQDCVSFEAVPATAPLRTLMDCINADLAPNLIGQAIHQARHRGLITTADEKELRDQLRVRQASGTR